MLAAFKRFLLFVIFCSIVGAFGLTAYFVYRSQDPVAQIESLLLTPENTIERALFSPDDDIKHLLITLINQETMSIRIASYTFTEPDIARAVIDAYMRGIRVEIITDRAYAGERHSKIHRFADKQIPVWVFQTSADDRYSGLMHNKFMIFERNILDRTILVTGSYNFTRRAGTANQENVIITDSKRLVNEFINQFVVIKERSLRISGTPVSYPLPIHKKNQSSLYNWIENIVKIY